MNADGYGKDGGPPRYGVAYLRVSGDEQAKGYGLDAQRAAIEAWADQHNVVIVGVYSDVVSGRTQPGDRDGMVDALAYLRERPGPLLVYRLDRIARDLVLQEIFLSDMAGHGSPVISVTEPNIDTDTDDPQRVLFRQIIGAIAQYERAMIRLRTQAGKRIKQQRGGWVNGPVPFGFMLVKGEVVKEPTEWPYLVRMVAWKRSGVTARGLAELCNDRGVPTRLGARWSKDTANRAVVKAEAMANRYGFDLSDPTVDVEPAPDELPPTVDPVILTGAHAEP